MMNTASAVEALPPRDHNRPTPADLASGPLERLGAFLSENPVIETIEQAKAGATLMASVSKTLADIEDDRDANVRPLNQRVKDINATYKAATTPVVEVLAMLKARLTAYAMAEEARRRQEADRLAREAHEALLRQYSATELYTEAEENAEQGEVGVDLVRAVTDVAAAEAEAGRAAREAARAGRDTGVRLATGFGRAASMRSREILTITDPVAAVAELGLTPDIEEAIRKGSAAFKKIRGRLPNGVTSHTERSL